MRGFPCPLPAQADTRPRILSVGYWFIIRYKIHSELLFSFQAGAQHSFWLLGLEEK